MTALETFNSVFVAIDHQAIGECEELEILALMQQFCQRKSLMDRIEEVEDRIEDLAY